MKKKKKRIISINDFKRLNNKEGHGHPTYIFAKIGKVYKYIGITHAEITKGMRNIKLDKNPDPNDVRNSYLHSKTSEASKDDFGKSLEGWRFCENDYKKVKDVIEGNSDKKKSKVLKKKGR